MNRLVVLSTLFVYCTCFSGTIKVDGKGVVKCVPDGVIMTFQIDSLHTNIVESLRLLSEREHQIVESLMQVGIQTNEIKTSAISLTRQCHMEDENGKMVHGLYTRDMVVKEIFEGYQHSIKFILLFPLLQERINKTYLAIISHQDIKDFEIRLCLLNPQSVHEQARVQAVENAKKIAESLCRAADSRIVSVLEIVYGESTRYAEDVPCGASIPPDMPVVDDRKPVTAAILPLIRAEDIEIGESVHIVWNIEKSH